MQTLMKINESDSKSDDITYIPQVESFRLRIDSRSALRNRWNENEKELTMFQQDRNELRRKRNRFVKSSQQWKNMDEGMKYCSEKIQDLKKEQTIILLHSNCDW